MSRLARTRELLGGLGGRRDLWLVGRVACFAATVPFLLRLPLPTLSALLTRAERRHPRVPREDAARLARCVEAAQGLGHPVVRGGCLTRGITLFWFLRRAGYPVELWFGVGPVDGDITGHCWLVLDGEAFLEPAPPEDRFTKLYRIPAGVPS